MSVSQFEQLDRYEDHDESRDRSLLQTAITEAFAFLNAGAGQEAIARIKRYRDLAARSDAGCYIFGLIYFNADDMRHALAWFDGVRLISLMKNQDLIEVEAEDGGFGR